MTLVSLGSTIPVMLNGRRRKRQLWRTPQDCIKSAHTKGVVIRNSDALRCRVRRLDDDVAARLVDSAILPPAAEDASKSFARNIAGQLHAMDKTSSLTR